MHCNAHFLYRSGDAVGVGNVFRLFCKCRKRGKNTPGVYEGETDVYKNGKTAFLELILMRCVCVCFSVYASYFKFAEQVFTPGGLERKPGDLAVFPKNLWITEKATGNLGRLFLPEENRTAKPPVVFYLLENIRRKVRGRFVVNRVEVNARTFSHFLQHRFLTTYTRLSG